MFSFRLYYTNDNNNSFKKNLHYDKSFKIYMMILYKKVTFKKVQLNTSLNKTVSALFVFDSIHLLVLIC